MSMLPNEPPEIVRPPITIGVLAIAAELAVFFLWRLSVQHAVFLLPPFLIGIYFNHPAAVPLVALAIAIFGLMRRPTKFCLALVFIAAILVFITPLLTADVEPEPLALPSPPATNLKSDDAAQREAIRRYEEWQRTHPTKARRHSRE
jgi:hypothetical protein